MRFKKFRKADGTWVFYGAVGGQRVRTSVGAIDEVVAEAILAWWEDHLLRSHEKSCMQKHFSTAPAQDRPADPMRGLSLDCDNNNENDNR